MSVTPIQPVALPPSRNCPLQLGLFFCWLLFSAAAFAQPGFYVPRQGSIYFGGDTATIFSNVINGGKFGVGKTAVVNFSGTSWENHPTALLTDESDTTTGTGGWVRFLHSTHPQQLTAGYNAATRTGPQFANLQIANRLGVYLHQSSVKVRNHVLFEQGRLHLANNTFVVGHNTPGEITGYNADRFFVTGIQPGNGFLLRENIRSSDGLVVFPIGKSHTDYTPAAIKSKSMSGDDYYLTAFAGVQSGLFTGTDLSLKSVNTVWQAGRMRLFSTAEAELFLQHQVKEEGGVFAQHRNNAYISQYVQNNWDVGTPQATPSPGLLTTGVPLATAGLNSRTFGAGFGKTAYFTKFTLPNSLQTRIIWGAYRLSAATVALHWQTKPEINVKYFVAQRRLANEAVFTNIGSMRSNAPNGISLDYLNYTMNDPNGYKGISYYRLQVFDYNGGSYYTTVVAVNGELGNKVVLWPNPTSGPFSVLANSPLATSMVIYNAIGQKMYVKAITAQNQSVVEVKDLWLIPGVYVVAILDKDGHVLDATKLVIQR